MNATGNEKPKRGDAGVNGPATGKSTEASRPSKAGGLKNRSLPAEIHNLLEEAIIQGEYEPSSRLHADDIAADYGVSRIPVREALRSLHQDGWVEIRPHYGVYVRERSLTELRELFETRSGVEGHIAALAAERRSDDELDLMRAIITRGRIAADNGDSGAVSLAALDFSRARRDACRNSVLATLSASLEKRARFYFTQVESLHSSEWAHTENELFDYIEERDMANAFQTAQRHILETGREAAGLLSGPIDGSSEISGHRVPLSAEPQGVST